MATLSHAESRQLYSWWWDSHISPKNSKWLQENLTDMNLKVKMMIKLIEEDADSFRKRAEMYYRKRPELMKLVVEFYRAYRALAGRYDHATGALRQAHRTMAEAFPDQIPLILLDESPPGPSSTDAELYTPEMHSHDREQRDAVDMSSRSAAFRGSGLYSELTDAATSEEGSWKSTTGEEFANGWARNRLPSQNTEGKSSGEKVQQAVQILSEENQNLKNQIAHETERADKAVAEVGNLKGTISKLESEQEDVSLQYKLALENISHDIERADKAETEVGYLKGTFSKRDTEKEDVSLQYKLAQEKISHEIERADQAEAEVGYLKGNISKLESEKEGVSLQYRLAREKISHETERADKAEAEVEYLKGTISKLESEKKDVSLQCQLALEKIASLEADISRIQEDFKKLNDEMVSGTSKSRSLEDRCYQLEKENQSLQLELGMLKEMAKNQQEELGMKQEETEKLNISINEERERAMQAEMTRLSLEKLHSQSQEEVRGLSLEIQNWVEKLMNVEMSKVGLEEEIQRLRGEIDSLNEQIRSSSLKIKSLQDEISLLEELKKKLQDEEGVHVEEKKSSQQEILSIKADKKALEQRHHELTEQIGAVNLNVDSLQTMVKELRDGNVELKELCRKHEDERVLHLQSLKFMEKITKRNVALENSLSNANAELEELREKVKTLQESCEALWRKMSMHISEKAVLMSQIEAIVRNMEKLSEKNTLLENSLSDVNVELEGLRSKLNVLEESCQSLRGQNSCLLDEKGALITQVESISQSLENLESRYAELEGKNLNLERERDHILHQARELQNSLRIQKEEYETLALSSRSQLDALEDQICILQERGRLREDELEVEHHKIINAQIENFVLQRILHDMKDNNVILSDKCQEYLETSRCQEELISELKQESFIQKDRLTWLSQYNDRLVEGIYPVMRALKVSKECSSPDVLHFNLILLEIEDLKGSILDAQDENQHLVLEKSVILTLLEQYRLDLAELQSEKNVLERESKTRFEELLALQSKEHQFLGLNEQLRQNLQACTQREEVLMGLNEQLRQNLQACTQREEVLMAEVEILCKKLSDVQEAHSALQSDTTKLMEENKSFSRKINDLSMENDTLEEHNSSLIAETVNLEHLYLVFRSYNAERALELQLLKDNMDRLHGDTSGLEQETISLNEKLGAAEIENMILKESLLSLEECKRCLLILEDEFRTVRDTCQDLDLQIEIGKNFLIQKDMELLQVSHGFQAVQDKNTELSGQIEGLMMEVDQAKAEREELEKKNLTLLEHNTRRDNEIADLHQSNDTLNEQLDKLIEEGEGLKKMEKHLTAELEDRIQEPKSCEVEIETLLGDIHVTTVKTETFEDKMLELLITCESLEISAMVQQQMFYEEIGRRSAYEEKLKERLDTLDGENRGLKEEQSAYLPLILSFGDFVTSLERRILPLANHSSLSNQEKKDGSQLVQQEKSNEEGNEDHHAFSSFGIFELQKLHAKVNALNQVVIDILNDLEQDRYASKTTSQAVVSEGEGLKALEAAPIGKDIILHLKKREETANLKKGNAETYKEKSEQIMKDIQLDHVLSSHYEKGSSSHAPSACGSDETKDQMMELWETVDCNTMEKTSPVTLDRDLECHQIEAVQEEKSVYSSCKLAAEKELNIDGLELTKKTESHREWSGSITDRLPSEAQRLSVLQKSTQELKKNMEASELSTVPTSFEFKKIKAQLKEAEAAISQLIDTNSKLTRKAEKLTSSSNSLGSEYIDEIGNTSERKISGQAQRGAEKIGRLELKLQKLEYIWVKLKEEHDYKRARAGDRRTRVPLMDYLYGKREGLRRMRVHCCACIRPRTRDESE